MNDIQFDIHLEAEKDVHALLIPASIYSELMSQSIDISNYTSQIISSRFSDVMWTLEQILFKDMDSRIAQALLEYAESEDTSLLNITHEALAGDVGTAREVVTRMLQYFRSEKMIALSRGQIELLDIERLQEVAQ